MYENAKKQLEAKRAAEAAEIERKNKLEDEEMARGSFFVPKKNRMHGAKSKTISKAKKNVADQKIVSTGSVEQDKQDLADLERRTALLNTKTKLLKQRKSKASEQIITFKEVGITIEDFSISNSATALEIKASEVLAFYPRNICAKALVDQAEAWVEPRLDPTLFNRLFACAKAGMENHKNKGDVDVGCFAIQPDDYDVLDPFFNEVVDVYHQNEIEHNHHVTNWETDGEYDLQKAGVEKPTVISARVIRNLKSFPLPGGMSKEDRVAFEKTVLKAFELLVNDSKYGGKISSLTPNEEWNDGPNPNFVDDAAYKELVAAKAMFEDMDGNAYLKSAGISSDWPIGRGCYQSEDKKCTVWFGGEDHLSVTCTGEGFIINEVYDQVQAVLAIIESVDSIEFAKSAKYGYVTSSPVEIGTGLQLSVQVKCPNLTAGGQMGKATGIGQSYGIDVLGAADSDGTITISPSSRLFVPEGDIVGKLQAGVKRFVKTESQELARAILRRSSIAD